VCAAGEKPTAGTIVSMRAVDCGTKNDKKKSTSPLCHQYVVRTSTTEYEIRQPNHLNKKSSPLALQSNSLSINTK
jgi:hypothetical protein